MIEGRTGKPEGALLAYLLYVLSCLLIITYGLYVEVWYNISVVGSLGVGILEISERFFGVNGEFLDDGPGLTSKNGNTVKNAKTNSKLNIRAALSRAQWSN